MQVAHWVARSRLQFAGRMLQVANISGIQISGFRFHVSCFRKQVSYFKKQISISGFKFKVAFQVSNFRFFRFFRFQISDLKLQVSDFQVSSFRFQVSCFMFHVFKN